MTTDKPKRGAIAGIILAGGRSSRMGREKTVMTLAGRPMIAHVAERFGPQVASIAINALPGFSAHRNLPIVPDTLKDHQGPLAGILSGLRHFSAQTGYTHMASVAGDGPFLPLDLVGRLTTACPDGNTIAIAASDGHMHPVYALWPISVADDLETWLGNPDNRRVKAFFARHPTVTVAFAPETTSSGPRDPFFNVNTPEDFTRAQTYLEQ
ncbi:molybdenum cofactor guanylyltransferase MobA [Rhizobiales bacterium RZME27]|uniref:Molybdenum cofactor guanylyltransferase n=1 Tax=Endobacterium cereale TaxID=2663029 RepID=A0A6A8A9N1_9HYPH|nr:molybdenum cofactor guanylyltransferase MobA [Endobacterium cereale]MEB2843595.1 molybdenum cofactor guanylyltransferase MobA [Endobacterium cereale]MQY45521.1 molybdenum cofactor guanylyltransferase MobA [Endobacterium cereale]